MFLLKKSIITIPYLERMIVRERQNTGPRSQGPQPEKY